MKYELELDTGHVIDPNTQLLAGIVKKGPRNISLCFSYENRNNKEMLLELGYMLLNIIRKIPNGVLLIFSSY